VKPAAKSKARWAIVILRAGDFDAVESAGLADAGGELRKVWRQRAGLIRRKNQTHSRRILETLHNI